MATAPRDIENAKMALGFKCIAGVDEAGRGPLVGPVVAAACVVPQDVELSGVTDSKALSEEVREALFEDITRLAFVGVGVIEPRMIDEVNILQATMLAMEQAVANLPHLPDAVLVDGNRVPERLKQQEGLVAEAFVKGDSRSLSIAAASIVAKVTRDRLMFKLHEAHPGYGFDQHKGYPTAAHMSALHKLGPLPEHRYSFGPVARVAAARGIVTDTYVDRREAAKASVTIATKCAPSKSASNAKATDEATGMATTPQKKRGRPPKARKSVHKVSRAAEDALEHDASDKAPAAPTGRVTRSRAKANPADPA